MRSILRLRAQLAAMSATIASTIAIEKPSASARASQPVMIRLRTHSIRYETGLIEREKAEPRNGDQVARRVHRGDEEEDEQHGEEPLDRLPGAGAEREEGAERTEAHRDESRVDEQQGDAGRPGREADAEEQPDGDVEHRLHDAEHDDAGDLPREKRGAANGCQRES